MIASDALFERDGDTDMSATQHARRDAARLRGLQRALAGCAAAAILVLGMQAGLRAADCPPLRQPNIPKSEEPALNIDKHKKQLRAYHKDDPPDAQNSPYINDIKLVIGDALAYITVEAGKVRKPAVVLDIDETSLSNWPNLDANDFGFIPSGACTLQAAHACGFAEWIKKARAPKLGPTLDFYNAVLAKNVAVFFVTGRRDSQRRATIRNLNRAGFKNWTRLMTRPDDDKDKSIVPFKSGQRAKIESENKDWGYTIIANIGDQQSDLDGEHAKCTFKIPNPFYFIE
jgi:hypothetical protein